MAYTTMSDYQESFPFSTYPIVEKDPIRYDIEQAFLSTDYFTFVVRYLLFTEEDHEMYLSSMIPIIRNIIQEWLFVFPMHHNYKYTRTLTNFLSEYIKMSNELKQHCELIKVLCYLGKAKVYVANSAHCINIKIYLKNPADNENCMIKCTLYTSTPSGFKSNVIKNYLSKKPVEELTHPDVRYNVQAYKLAKRLRYYDEMCECEECISKASLMCGCILCLYRHELLENHPELRYIGKYHVRFQDSQ